MAEIGVNRLKMAEIGEEGIKGWQGSGWIS